MSKKRLKPTPGPWLARKGDVMNPERSWGIVRPLNKRECREVDGDLRAHGDRSEVIAEVYAASGGRDEADAKLLAAAPDLAAALQQAVGVIQMAMANGAWDHESTDEKDSIDEVNSLLACAEEALKKAGVQ